MNRLIVSIKSEEESIDVQRKLINEGVFWVSGTRYPTFTDKPFLCVDSMNTKKNAISYREKLPCNIEFSDLYKHKLITADNFLDT
jgi:hypothetical protein